jgi:cytochrome b6-f complex iron-sulfur subunit
MKRREFTRWMTAGAIASSLPVAIAACSNGSSTSASSTSASSPAASSVAAAPEGGATVAALDQAGFVNITVNGKPATIVRNPDKQDEILAVNTMCTHKGCTVAWKSEQKAFVCPCHGAKFAAGGAVTAAPADKPLTAYKVKVAGDKITVEA